MGNGFLSSGDRMKLLNCALQTCSNIKDHSMNKFFGPSFLVATVAIFPNLSLIKTHVPHDPADDQNTSGLKPSISPRLRSQVQAASANSASPKGCLMRVSESQRR